jgi:hypothetical protein
MWELLENPRAEDGYVDAVPMCEAADKSFGTFFGMKRTKAYLQWLAREEGIPASELIKCQVRGRFARNREIWVHPLVAHYLAQWLSPSFAVDVHNIMMSIALGGSETVH